MGSIAEIIGRRLEEVKVRYLAVSNFILRFKLLKKK